MYVHVHIEYKVLYVLTSIPKRSGALGSRGRSVALHMASLHLINNSSDVSKINPHSAHPLYSVCKNRKTSSRDVHNSFFFVF